MKKTIFALAMMLCTVAVVFAQDDARQARERGTRHQQMNPERMAEHRVAALDKELALTADQKAAITAIYEEEAKAMKQNMERRHDGKQKVGKPDREARQARHQAMKARQDEVNAKVAAVLTADQKVKFEQMKNDRGKRGAHRNGMKAGKDNPQGEQSCCKTQDKADKKACEKKCCDDKQKADKQCCNNPAAEKK